MNWIFLNAIYFTIVAAFIEQNVANESHCTKNGIKMVLLRIERRSPFHTEEANLSRERTCLAVAPMTTPC